jgi:hypothetical protein
VDASFERPRAQRIAITLVTFALTVAVLTPWARNVELLGDEGVVLLGAQRLLSGERLYVDFFEILPPGAFWLVAGWMRVFGDGFLAIRALSIGIIAVAAALAAELASRRMRGAVGPVLLAMAFVLSTQGLWTSINHHWLTTLSVLGALSLLATPRLSPARVVSAGALVGLAALFTHTHAAVFFVLALARFAGRDSGPRDALRFVTGTTGVFAIALVVLAAGGSLGGAVDDVIVYPLRHYASVQTVSYGSNAEPRAKPILIVMPLAIGLLAASMWRRREPRDGESLVTLSFALGALMTSFPRPDVEHLSFNALICVPALGLAAATLGTWSGRATAIAGGAWLVVAIPGFVELAKRAASAPTVHVARGDVAPGPAAAPDDLRSLLAAIAVLPRDASIAVYPYDPMIAFLDQRRHVAPVDVFLPTYTAPEHYRLSCERTLRDAEWVVIDRPWSDPAFLALLYPTLSPERIAEEKDAFEGPLRAGYVESGRFGDRYALLRRRPGTTAALCLTPRPTPSPDR